MKYYQKQTNEALGHERHHRACELAIAHHLHALDQFSSVHKASSHCLVLQIFQD